MLENLTSLFTLTAMEIVLGIDNIIFIAIIVSRLPAEIQNKVRITGLALALIFRILLLFSISWIMGLNEPLFAVLQRGFSGRDLVLLGGGLFLLVKATLELHHKVNLLEEGAPITTDDHLAKKESTKSVYLQIILLDLVFSLDSVITAVGMVKEIWIMVVAVIIAIVIMMVAAKSISAFVDKNPTIKILALSFLILIGVMLVAEGMGMHVPKGYIYFAMAFSLAVEMLNMRYQKKRRKLKKVTSHA